MPKATATSAHKRRHNPLEDDLLATGVLKTKTGKSKREGVEKEEEHYVDAKASRNILAMSRNLIEEDEEENARRNPVKRPSAFDYDPARFGADSDPEDQDGANDEEAWGDEDEVVEEIEVDADDLETFNRFLAPSMNDDPLLTHGWDGKGAGDEGEEGQSTNLADLILAKIAERESAMQGGVQEEVNPVEEEYELPPKVVEVYTKYASPASGKT